MAEWSRRGALSALLGWPAAAVALCGGLSGRAARAQGVGTWPAGPLRIVVPFAPGGSTDAVARLASPGLQHALGAPVVVENRSGAAGSLGSDVVAKARPDGQTWLLTFDSHAVMPVLVPKLPFDLRRDLQSVMLIGGAPYVVACRPDKPTATSPTWSPPRRRRPTA